MRLYLDNCCLQRPHDDQTQPRIRVETEAVFAVLATVQAGEQSLLGSEALEYEVSRIPDETRRNEVLAVLALASERLQLTDAVEALAPLSNNTGWVRWTPSIWRSHQQQGLISSAPAMTDFLRRPKPFQVCPAQSPLFLASCRRSQNERLHSTHV